MCSTSRPTHAAWLDRGAHPGPQLLGHRFARLCGCIDRRRRRRQQHACGIERGLCLTDALPVRGTASRAVARCLFPSSAQSRRISSIAACAMPSDDGCRARRRDGERRDAKERSVDPRIGERADRQMRWHERVVDQDRLAACAPHPCGVPCVEDREVSSWQREHPHLGRASRRRSLKSPTQSAMSMALTMSQRPDSR